jgi:hypothetical protein
MITIHDLTRWLRDYGHDPRHLPRLISNGFLWHQIWTAVDIIDDVDLAMTSHLENEFSADDGERYLRIYGVMQGLFLQQDALVDLIKAIHPTKQIQLNDVLKDVREARNASVGHPTQLRRKGALSAHAIVRHSMSKEGFELHSYPRKEGNTPFDYISIVDLIKNQRIETIRILTEVVNDLREQERSHRSKFKDTKLMRTFDQVGYAFEKISEELGRKPILSKWAVNQLQVSLDNFANLLRARGLNLEEIDSIKYLYVWIRHPLTELTKFINNEPSEVLSTDSTNVFLSALQKYFAELREIAREIDEEYESEPNPIVPTTSDNAITLTITTIGK